MLPTVVIANMMPGGPAARFVSPKNKKSFIYMIFLGDGCRLLFENICFCC